MLTLPFKEQEYIDALAELNIAFKQEYLCFNSMPEELTVEYYESYIGFRPRFRDAIELNLCEIAYGYASAPGNVNIYMDDIGVSDASEYMNLCLGSEDVYVFYFDNGYGDEGYGHYLLDEDDSVPDFIREYIYYEDYGCDHNDDIYVHDECFHDPYEDSVDLTYYEPEELYRELDWDIEYEPVAKRTVSIKNEALFNML